MLCKKCSAIPFQDSGSTWEVCHHETFAELEQSAKNGCNLCSMFRKVTLEYYANFVTQCIEKAEIYHQALDKHAKTFQRSKRLAISADQDGFGSTGKEDDSSNDGSEGYKDGNNFCSFFVGAVGFECDSALASLENGIQRLLYTREFSHEDNDSSLSLAQPVQDIWPVVRISCLPDSAALHKWNIIGRATQRMPELDLAKAWLHECIAKHSGCRGSGESRLPTRVLDLASTTDIQLVVNQKSSQPYATLSHRWGGSQPMTLTSETYEAFQKNISYSKLPKNFKDAVIVSKALGIRYLWIDSLCIIQDSKIDWEEQCAKMAQIYSDSIVTIAGPAAPYSEFGFLHPRELLCQTTIESSDSETSSEIVVSQNCIQSGPYDLIPEPDRLLAQRGWVLQERLLSTRVLYFGSHDMYFECFTNVRIDSCHLALNELSFDGVTKSIVGELECGPGAIQVWMAVVKAYSRTSLTRLSDRLPALSGLASHFHHFTKAAYLAGLWHEDLQRQLCWHTRVKIEDGKPGRPNSELYTAPSWSWASVSRPVTFLVTNCYTHTFNADMNITSAHVMTSGKDTFGAVGSGYLTVRGRVRSAVVRKDIQRKTLYVQSDVESALRLAIYSPDDDYASNPSEFSVLLLYLGRFSPRATTVALAIRRHASSQNVCKRVGLAYARDGSQVTRCTDFAKWLSNADKIDLRIL